MSNYTNENLINVPASNVPAGTLAMKVGDNIFTAGNVIIGGTADYYKCASVDTVNLTWTGYKAVQDPVTGVYSFESNPTIGLLYTDITPVISGIYTSDAKVSIASLYDGLPYPSNFVTFKGSLLDQITGDVGINEQGSTGGTLTNDGISFSGTGKSCGFDVTKFNVSGLNAFTLCLDIKSSIVPSSSQDSVLFCATSNAGGYTKVAFSLKDYPCVYFRDSVTGDTGTPIFVYSDTAISKDVWYSLSAVFNAPNVTLYLNGNVVGTFSSFAGTTATSYETYVGGARDDACYATIRNLRFFKTALTQQQIQKLVTV